MQTSASTLPTNTHYLRVLVMGGPGSGTSTLGRALAKMINARHLETDDYQWQQDSQGRAVFQIKTDLVCRTQAFVRDLQYSGPVVVSGSLDGWGRSVEDNFDLVVFCVLDTSLRLQRIRERDEHRFGRVNQTFLEWAAGYDDGNRPGRSRASHEKWLAARCQPVVRIQGDLTLEGQLEKVLQALAAIKQTT